MSLFVRRIFWANCSTQTRSPIPEKWGTASDVFAVVGWSGRGMVRNQYELTSFETSVSLIWTKVLQELALCSKGLGRN